MPSKKLGVSSGVEQRSVEVRPEEKGRLLTYRAHPDQGPGGPDEEPGGNSPRMYFPLAIKGGEHRGEMGWELYANPSDGCRSRSLGCILS